MNRRKKLDGRKILVAILLILIIIAIIILVVKTQKTNETISYISEEKIDTKDPKKEKLNNTLEVNTTKENIPKEINFLDNLNVPVYKKNEKNIKIPILIYHAFRTPIPKEDTSELFSNEKNFEENVKTLLDDGYTFITLEELEKYNSGKLSLPEKVIIITMDDGWSGAYTEAYPILKKYKIPTTIFIVNKLVGSSADYFTWEQAKEMYDSGLVKIESHGYSHINYTTVSKKTLQSDYNKSHEEIKEHLKSDKIPKIMAYPAGASTKETIKNLKEIGFNIQVQTKYGTVNKSSTLDLTNLGRIRAERATGKQILATINTSSLTK